MEEKVFWSFLLALSVTTNSPATGLSSAQLHGKEIYHTGKGRRGEDITVEIAGGVMLTADRHPCVQCHGIEGKGGLDGGILIPGIDWDRLSSPHGVPTALGDIRPPYSGETFAAAVRRGIASSGEALDIMMPHYQLDDTDINDLLAYLQAIGKENAPGIDNSSITIGMLLPVDTSRQGRAIATLLRRYLDGVNDRGGIHGRTIRFIIKDPGATEESALEATRAMIGQNMSDRNMSEDNSTVFCFLANAGTGASPGVLNLLQQQRIPVIGPLTFAHGAPATGLVYYLLASLEDEARAGANFLLQNRDAYPGKIALISTPSEMAGEMARGFSSEAGRIGLDITLEKAWDSHNGAEIVREMSAADTATVVFFGSAEHSEELAMQARQINWAPLFMTSPILSGPPPRNAPSILITPALAPSAVGLGAGEFHSLIYGNNDNRTASTSEEISDPSYRAMQMLAYASARLFTETLFTIGRDLNRHYLLTAIRTLRRFETGVMPPISFGPNRRVGARGALIITNTGDGKSGNQWVSLTDD